MSTNKPFPQNLTDEIHLMSKEEIDSVKTFNSYLNISKKLKQKLHHQNKSEDYKKLKKIQKLHPHVFEKYILEHKSYAYLKKLKFLKEREIESKKIKPKPIKPKAWEETVFPTDKLLSEGTVGQYEALYKVFPILQKLTHSDGFKFFIICSSGAKLKYFRPELLPMGLRETLVIERREDCGAANICLNTNVASHVAFNISPTISNDVSSDERFPDGALSDEDFITSVLGVPIILANGELFGVLEMYRKSINNPYTLKNLSLVMKTLSWVLNTIYRARATQGIVQLHSMSSFLLNTTGEYLLNDEGINKLLSIIMRQAKLAIGADRCALYLYDEDTNMLFCDLFDTGNIDENGNAVFDKSKEIRFSLTQGIAGYSALYQTIVNVTDPYNDQRFNDEIDNRTGYTTRSVIAAPILSDGKLYGVLQLVNKIGNKLGHASFSQTDVKEFQTYTVYCSIAVRYRKTSIQIRKQNARTEIYKQMYTYYNTLNDSRVKSFVSELPKRVRDTIPDDFENYFFLIHKAGDQDLYRYFLYMIKATTVPRLLPHTDVIVRFIMSIKESYRDLPYHNFRHAMTFTHAMFCTIRKHRYMFKEEETLPYMIASVIHDIDHRGFSSTFMHDSGHPMGIVYGKVSTLECHQFAFGCDVISRKGCNVFHRYTKQEVIDAYQVMERGVLATDLPEFFSTNAKLHNLLNKGDLDISILEHRNLVTDALMVACDLIVMAKKF